jgi:hypothetical protein
LIGLEGKAGSLLGWGLRALVTVFFENEVCGAVFDVVAGDGAGLGEFVDFFWKKPKMDFWLLEDCEAEAGCFFFCEARGVDISLPSIPRTMVRVAGINSAALNRKRSKRCAF